jgi:hypothetical protein
MRFRGPQALLDTQGEPSFGLVRLAVCQQADKLGEDRMTNEFRIAKVQRTLRWFEQDIPLLNMRVKELSMERQESAKKFVAAMIDQTRAELERLLQEQPNDQNDPSDSYCEPAD